MVDTTKATQHSTGLYESPSPTESDLKSIRESKGLTLKDIFECTRISVANLAAIEMGHFHLLPSPVFTKSFIKTYAKTLGIESDVILARYAQYLETLNPASRDVKIKETPKYMRSFYKFSLWGLLAIITIGLVTFSLSTYETLIGVVNDRTSEQENKAFSLKTNDAIEKIPKSETPDQANVATGNKAGDAQSIPVAQTQLAVPEEQEKQNAKQEDTVSAVIDRKQGHTAETYQIIMAARELTWLRVNTDNKPPYEVLLQPGEKIERYASHLVVIDIGNAGGIDITFQGKSLGNLGERGQVVHLKLPQD
ncbi:MAG TPA: RodZ domain-containing protein [Syntrophales bacterium]|nr:RodZ domain-containing protein [Syntrophales bacterium]